MGGRELTILLARFNRASPAALDAIARFEGDAGIVLPSEYRSFLLVSNGGEGFVGDEYLILWSVEELAPLNEGYEVKAWAPGLLLFGSSGGGEAHAFDLQNDCAIVSVPFVGMDRSAIRAEGPTFGAFLELLHNRPADE